jgi:hemerythrin-like domain-containing protein
MNRRNFMSNSGRLSAGLVLARSLSKGKMFAAESTGSKESMEKKLEVTAVEDLMREHGVLRRILFVYSEVAAQLRQEPAKPINEPLHEAAKLFRDFGENYHEKALEEACIFPALLKTRGEASTYPEILIAQHKRGREITDYIFESTAGKLPPDIPRLASLLETMVRMYRPHAAREDTIVFPAWKQTMNPEQYDEMNDKFEDIEHQQFGEDGFEMAVSKVAEIEKQLGLFDLSQFTPKALTL